jgi:ribonuclease P/MRP protein subunit RPP40
MSCCYLNFDAYGINGILLAWIAQFLCNRRQYISFNGCKSKCMHVPSGVIQGSVIGPVLFGVYIIDITDVIASSGASLYADDLKLWRAIRCENDRVSLQSDVRAVYEWSQKWLMPSVWTNWHTYYIGSRLSSGSYQCGISQIRLVEQVKDLGVIYCSSMSFRPHHESVRKKAHGVCAMIFKSFECRDAGFLAGLFCMYVRPLLEYYAPIWSPHLKCDIASIERVQRMFTKRIFTLRHFSCAERLKALNLQSLEQR